MFILYALLGGILLGALTRGRLDALADMPFRWGWLVAAGLVLQILLFSPPAAGLPDPIAPALYVASTGAVLVAVVANSRIPGMALVAAGAGSNLLAILANGGRMPADPSALAAVGDTLPDGATNSVLLGDPALRPLTDIFALPSWLPLANVFSIGDVLIAVGIAVVVAAGMHRRARHP